MGSWTFEHRNNQKGHQSFKNEHKFEQSAKMHRNNRDVLKIIQQSDYLHDHIVVADVKAESVGCIS